MPFNVLLASHWMVGCDLHDGIPPPGPIPQTMIPHLVGARMHWLLPLCSEAKTLLGPGSSAVMLQGTDISNMIPHLGLNLLFPLATLTSGSKSHFGASTVTWNDKPIAAAILIVVNLNLNCSGPTIPPLPSGFVIAPNTVMVGLTLGDILGGVFSLVVDSAISYGLNKFFGGKFFGNILGKLEGPLIQALFPNAPKWISLATAFVNQGGLLSNPWIAQNLSALIGTVIPFIVGSPLGYSPPLAPVGAGGNFVDNLARKCGQGLGNSIDEITHDSDSPEYGGRPTTY